MFLWACNIMDVIMVSIIGIFGMVRMSDSYIYVVELIFMVITVVVLTHSLYGCVEKLRYTWRSFLYRMKCILDLPNHNRSLHRCCPILCLDHEPTCSWE